MVKSICQTNIAEGDKLTEIEGGAKVTVTEVTKDDIAWFKSVPEGGEFGECSRAMAASLFSNVAACESAYAS